MHSTFGEDALRPVFVNKVLLANGATTELTVETIDAGVVVAGGGVGVLEDLMFSLVGVVALTESFSPMLDGVGDSSISSSVGSFSRSARLLGATGLLTPPATSVTSLRRVASW